MAFSIETFAKSEKLPTYKKNIAFCDIGEYISQCFEPLRQTGMKILFQYGPQYILNAKWDSFDTELAGSDRSF